MAGEHENRTHLTVLTYGDSGFEGRDGHQLRNLSLEGTAASEIAAWKLNYQEIILETMVERNFFISRATEMPLKKRFKFLINKHTRD